MKFKSIPLCLLLACGLPALAREAATPPPPVAGSSSEGSGFLQAPEAPDSPVGGEPGQPDITIREDEKETIYEYRVRGQLYMIKIQPQIGPAYFLMDTNGDGTMDMRSADPRDINIPQWVLFSWN